VPTLIQRPQAVVGSGQQWQNRDETGSPDANSELSARTSGALIGESPTIRCQRRPYLVRSVETQASGIRVGD